MLWNDSATPVRAVRGDRLGSGRRDLQPGHRAGRAAQRPAAVAAAHPRVRGRAPHRVGVRDRLGHGRASSRSRPRRCSTDAFAEHRGRNGRLSVQTDPRLYRDADAPGRPGGRVRRAGAQRHREDPGHRDRHPRDGGGHLPRRQHQRHRLLHGAAGGRRRRGHRARAAAPRGRGARRRRDGPGLHDHGRPARRLAEGGGQARRHHRRPRRTWSGPASRCSSRPTRSSTSAASAPGCCRRPSATTCTGASSSAATSSSPRPSTGRCGSTPAASSRCRASTSRCADAVLDTLYEKFPEFRRAYDADGMAIGGVRALRRHPQDAAPVPGRLRRPRGPRPRRAAARPGEVSGGPAA